jgi:phenylpropionate dioxygenase-like ring-hydroxylating dioxygenase large terminal subunit
MVSTSIRKHAIDPNLAQAWTLPASVYLDPAVLETERQAIFGRTWQIVGRVDQVAKPGDYFTTELLGEPLLLVRDYTSQVRGFYNVCRHRAGPPAAGCGNRKVFRCGYHGWTYNLEGKLLNAPEMEGTQNFRVEDFGLRPVRTEAWGPWVFVNLDDDCEPLTVSLRALPTQTEKFHIGRLQFYKRQDYFMDCNWKVYLDNYLEGYHLPSVHPGLNRELDYNQYTTDLFDRHSRQSSPIRGPENEATVDRRYRQSEGDLAAEYYWIFPNWMLNCYPDNTSLNIVLPLGPEKCVAIFEFYFTPEQLASDVAEKTCQFSHQIQIEDGGICELVHKNLKSRSYERGRFSVKQEKGVHHFHQLYSQAIS